MESTEPLFPRSLWQSCYVLLSSLQDVLQNPAEMETHSVQSVQCPNHQGLNMSNRYHGADATKCAQPLRSREPVEGARGPGLWRVIRSLLVVNCRGVFLFSRIDVQFISIQYRHAMSCSSPDDPRAYDLKRIEKLVPTVQLVLKAKVIQLPLLAH